MKSSRPSDGRYQVFGTSYLADGPLRRRGSLEDLVRQEKPGALPAQPAMAPGRQDHAAGQLREVLDLNVLLGDPDEVDLLGEQSLGE